MRHDEASDPITAADVDAVAEAIARVLVGEDDVVPPSDEVLDHEHVIALDRAGRLRPRRALPAPVSGDLDPRAYARLLLLTTPLSALEVAGRLCEHYALGEGDAMSVVCAALL